MAIDTFDNSGGGASVYLGVSGGGPGSSGRADWFWDGNGSFYSLSIAAGATALKSFPDSGSTLFKYADQGSADHLSRVVVLGACNSWWGVRTQDRDHGFYARLSQSGVFQVFRFNAFADATQLGTDFAATPSGQDVILSALGTTISFTVDGVHRCGSPFTGQTAYQTETRQGLLAGGSGIDPWLDLFEASLVGGGGGGGGSIWVPQRSPMATQLCM